MSLEESKSRKEKKTENQKHEHTSCTHAPTSALLHRAESVDAENFEHPQRPGSLPENSLRLEVQQMAPCFKARRSRLSTA